MEVAIVTGASRGCGLAVAEKLVSLGYVVYALARDFSQCTYVHPNFHPINCDLTQTDRLLHILNEVIKRDGNLKVVVNNAGIGVFGPHENIARKDIENMVATNLLAPLLITHAVLRPLREMSGVLINISSTAATRPHRFGCAYAATKAGLAQFGRSLFQEVRKSGVRVATIYPDFVRSSFHDLADFGPGSAPSCYLEPSCVASAVEQILSQRPGTVLSEIVLEPQKLVVEKKNKPKKPAGE